VTHLKSTNITSQCVKQLKILGDESRFRIVQSLIDSSKNVTEIMNLTGIPQSLLSHHLTVLKKSGLINSAKEGNTQIYSITSSIFKNKNKQIINLGCCQLNFN
jgi:DNA-binding transcriptional ArsR family regulator